jgi:Holliday junction resolvase RusA-like endonuclease
MNARREWVLSIPNWTPPSVNRLWKASHWSVGHRIKQQVGRTIYGAWLVSRPAVMCATGKRRVSVAVTVAGRGGMIDPDNALKTLLDGLVKNHLLVDDSARYCEIGVVRVERGKEKGTVVTLEDLD